MKILVFAPMLFLCTAGAFAAPPSGFDGRVESLRNDIGVPSMAIAISYDYQDLLFRPIEKLK